MKIREVKNQIIRRHLRLDAKNNKRELKLLRLQKGTPEQLELYKICMPLNKWLMKVDTQLAL